MRDEGLFPGEVGTMFWVDTDRVTARVTVRGTDSCLLLHDRY